MTTSPTWPPSTELLALRRDRYELDDELPVTALHRDGELPDWLALPAHLNDEELEEETILACSLAFAELASTLSDVLWIHAVEHPDGGYLIVIHDEYETEFRPPIERAAQPLTLAEMQRNLDETEWVNEDGMLGVGHAVRERSELADSDRASLVDFVTIRSELYPQLEALDRDRARQWAERGQ